MALRPRDFESRASTVPPLRPDEWQMLPPRWHGGRNGVQQPLMAESKGDGGRQGQRAVERARPPVRLRAAADRRHRGGVHAPRPGRLRPRLRRRGAPRRGGRGRDGRPAEARADAVRARVRHDRLRRHPGRGDRPASDPPVRRPPGPRRTTCASARRARTRSRCSRTRRSPPATATARSSRCSSTSPAASSCSGCTSTSPCPTPEACLAVMEGVLIELPVLLALSANSPFWRGEHTGLASSRAMIFSAFPRSGLPPRFADYQRLRRGGRVHGGDGSDRRLHPPVVGRAPAPALRHPRAAGDGLPDAGRGRDRARRLRRSAW